MDRKEVTRTKPARSATRHAGETAASPTEKRRLFILYGFTGAVFCLGFAALMTVIRLDLKLAGQFILAATVFASLEYYVRRGSVGANGHLDELSTLSDLLCFSVAPGFLIYRLTLQHWGILGLGSVFVVVFAGVLRLSLYKIYNPVGEKRDFIGIPLTLTAAFIALLAQLPMPPSPSPFFRLGLMALVIVLAFLTVSTIRYPNPSASPWFAAAMTLATGAVLWGPPVKTAAVWSWLACGAAYVLFAPLIAGRRK